MLRGVNTEHMRDRHQERIVGPAKPRDSRSKQPKTKTDSMPFFQFKITLADMTPPIWRRIQVGDCTLDKLHEHIQTAMGWTNSHLYQFEINGKQYGHPELLGHGFEGVEPLDSTRTKLSKILPKDRKRCEFRYEYDFGDSWIHEVVFEGCPPRESGKRYPLCVEGARACPPEDVGGVWRYAELLEELAGPKHEQHDDPMTWCGGDFDSEKFDPAEATQAMRKGLSSRGE